MVCAIAVKPILKKIETDGGEMWQITYAGMTRTVRDEWQARVYLHMACQMYSEDGCTSCDAKE